MAARRAAVPALVTGAIPRVNLMPRAAIERRERSVLLRRWGWGLASALLVVAVVSAGAFTLQAAAQVRLALEQARTSDLLTQVGALQSVGAKVALQTELTEFRAKAMGTDLAWTEVVTAIEGVLPADVTVIEYSLSPGGLPQAEVDPAALAGVQGTMALTGPTPIDIVALIRDVRAIPGVLIADGWAQTQAGDGYRYDLRVEFDQSVYTGSYAPEVAE